MGTRHSLGRAVGFLLVFLHPRIHSQQSQKQSHCEPIFGKAIQVSALWPKIPLVRLRRYSGLREYNVVTMRVLALLMFFLSQSTVGIAPTESALEGAWLDTASKWVKAPKGVAPKEEFSQTAVLYFGKDHKFTVIYCTVIRVPKIYMNISNGDPRDVYRGEWSVNENTVSLTYQLVERTVPIQGQTLPGPIQHATFKVPQDATLSFDRKQFRREVALDGNASY